MKEIFLYFFRLGCLGFGGPLALIAQMQKELVEDRRWMTPDEFRQVFGLIKTMPGPVAFQAAVFLGYHRKKFFGGLVAGLCMVFPAFVLMVLLAHYHQAFTENIWLSGAMRGMELAAFALIAWALKSLSQNFLKQYLFWVLGAVGIALSLFTSIPEPLLILVFGLTAIAASRIRARSVRSVELTLSLICLKAGAFVFGTGLAIVPFLEEDFVRKLNWLTHEQFMDALAFGQLTPGPVVITVAFIGYKVAGLTGAVVATVSIFLPAFIHMVTWFPRMISWMKKQAWIAPFTLGVTAAVCSAITVALGSIAKGWNVIQILGVLLCLLLLRFLKVPSWALILGAGIVGALVTGYFSISI